jgi:hypothetical protein
MNNPSKTSAADTRAADRAPIRRPYEPPKLECYGSISKLTLNGQGPGTDGGSSSTMMMHCL